MHEQKQRTLCCGRAMSAAPKTKSTHALPIMVDAPQLSAPALAAVHTSVSQKHFWHSFATEAAHGWACSVANSRYARHCQRIV